jgi:hypothetical protein
MRGQVQRECLGTRTFLSARGSLIDSFVGSFVDPDKQPTKDATKDSIKESERSADILVVPSGVRS